MKVTDFSLLHHNTFGIDACCKRFIECTSVEELQACMPLPHTDDEPLLILGGGSNLLLTRDFPGTVVHAAIKGMEVREQGDDIFVRCGSGEVWDDMVATWVRNGWHGAENLSFIPGEVGASAVQNIGAYGAEAKDLITEIEAVEAETGKPVTLTNAECAYGYRSSKFKNEWKNRYIITHVTYRLSRVFTPHTDYGNIKAMLEARHIDTPTAQQLRDTIIYIRQEKLPDPLVEGNAGSFFMNPMVGKTLADKLLATHPTMPHYVLGDRKVKIPAGWLIEQCGWKGRSLGKAAVHAKQALVLVNKGGATGADILRLCQAIIADVEKTFGITLHPEVNIV